MDTLLVVKIMILVYIVLSPFISYTYMRFFNYTAVKIAILILIILVSFVDLQLAVLLMIAFLILLVNLNKENIFKVKQESTQESLLPQVLSDIKTLPEKLYTQSIQPKITLVTSEMGLPPIPKETMIRGNSLYPIPSDIIEVPPNSYTNPPGTMERFVDMELDPNLDFRMKRAQLADQLNEQIREQTYNPVHAQTMYEFPKPYCKGVENIDPYIISNNLFLYSTDERTKPYEEYVKILSPECALKDAQTNEL